MNEQYVKDYFKFKARGKAKEEAIIQGDKYRITLLTSRLIRFEYSNKGEFEDRPTQTFWFREQVVPSFSKEINKGILTIETDHLLITYDTSLPYTNYSLKIFLKDLKSIWSYGDQESANLRGTARTLDGVNGKTFLDKGILARNGYAVIDDSDSLVFNKHYWLEPRKENTIDFYFFGYGHDYLNALKDYYSISGKTPMIPRFAFGNWWSRYWAYSEDELKELILNFEKYEIPLSVCIIDMDWHIVDVDPKYIKNHIKARWSYGWTGYTWNKALFPEPIRMLEFLHEKKLNVALNLHPADGIRPHEESYEALADFMDVDKENMDTVEFDIADPKFVSGYFDLVHHPLENMGVDFWWLDWQQGTKSNLGHLDPLWMLNHLHFLDLGRNGKRPFTFSRYASKGSHRYPIGFSGDTVVTWESLDFQPYFTATASNIGYGYWSHDIGGHMGGIENGELYTRWVQLGVFSPILRLHSSKNQFTRREPWRYDLNVLDTVSRFMRLRHQLIPYLYTMAYHNYKDGIPIVRPLYYYEPENQQAYSYPNEFYFGDELIVSPITKPMNQVTNRHLQSIYLPVGNYFDFFTKEFIHGGISHHLYNLNEMPVFCKAGGIIVLDQDLKNNGTDLPKQLDVEIYPLDSGHFELYEDDGETSDYTNGAYHITTFDLTWDQMVTFEIKQNGENPFVENRTYKLRFNCMTSYDTIETSSHTDALTNHYFENGTLVVEVLSNQFSSLSIKLSGVNVEKRDLRMTKVLSMLLDAQFNYWRKQDIYNVLMKKLPYEKMMEEIMAIEDVPSDVVVNIMQVLK